MRDEPDVVVLRYGHRPGRDDRMTTHVGLTARALGADGVLFPTNAGQSKETVDGVTERFGGPFVAELRGEQRAAVRDWQGIVVHLTMYGEPVQDVEDEIRRHHRGDGDEGDGGEGDGVEGDGGEGDGVEGDGGEGDGVEGDDATGSGEPILVVVGGEKVPFELYERADYNVAVTNQPHSEVAGLAVFLDRLFEGRELDREWEDADRRVLPRETGKEVVPVEELRGDDGGSTSRSQR
ncbi:MAG: tRNA (cytidine(56)-2'-O)-methyltransferase [Haloferacaceae archaeon]